MNTGPFPQYRPRRLRRGQCIRDAVADVTISVKSLILPIFVSEAEEERPVSSMPGVSQLPAHGAVERVRQLRQEGLTQFIFFGVTPATKKDARGSYAWSLALLRRK